MLLSEYFTKRCGGEIKKGLGVIDLEKRKFKIPDTTQGWYKRVKDIEIPDSLILEVCEEILNKKLLKSFKLARIKLIRDDLLGITLEPYDKNTIGKSFVYIMKNELGMFKIGISKTPQLRARSLTTSSGLNVDLIAYFSGLESSKDVERNILFALRSHIKLGEWFRVNSVSFEDITSLLPESYVRVS